MNYTLALLLSNYPGWESERRRQRGGRLLKEGLAVTLGCLTRQNVKKSQKDEFKSSVKMSVKLHISTELLGLWLERDGCKSKKTEKWTLPGKTFYSVFLGNKPNISICNFSYSYIDTKLRFCLLFRTSFTVSLLFSVIWKILFKTVFKVLFPVASMCHPTIMLLPRVSNLL